MTKSDKYNFLEELVDELSTARYPTAMDVLERIKNIRDDAKEDMVSELESKRVDGNTKCMKYLKYIRNECIDGGKDVISMTDSLIFGIPYEECCEFIDGLKTSLTCKTRRDMVKRVMLNQVSAEDLEKENKAFCDKIVEIFPYTPKEDLKYPINNPFDNLCHAIDFMTMIRGYILIERFVDGVTGEVYK